LFIERLFLMTRLSDYHNDIKDAGLGTITNRPQGGADHESGILYDADHPLDKDWRLSLKEDREAFLLADELGFTEAYVGEHLTDRAENITSCIAFLAWIAAATKQIRLGTGTINMPNTHPAAVAASMAMLDHMLDGRLIFGISPADFCRTRNCSVISMPTATRCFLSDQSGSGYLGRRTAVQFLRKILEHLDAKKTLIEDIGQGFIAKAVAAAASAHRRDGCGAISKGVTEAAARGWDPISANFLMPAWVKSHWPKYVEGCERGGRAAEPANWRVAKSVFVARTRRRRKPTRPIQMDRTSITIAPCSPS